MGAESLMRCHSLAPGDARVRAHSEIGSSIATDADIVATLLPTSDTNMVVAALLATAYVTAARLIAALPTAMAFTAALATTARAFGNGWRWTEGDQREQDRK